MRAINSFEMVCAGRFDFDSEAGRARVSELFGMDAGNQPAGASGFQDRTRLLHRESAAIAEDIAKFRKAGSGDGGDPAAREQFDVRGGTTPIFLWNDVCAQEGGCDVERLVLVKFGESNENFQLAFPVEAIAALGFDCRSAVGAEFAKVRERGVVECVRGGLAKPLDGGMNSAAAVSDFFVGSAGDALFVFGGAAAGKNQMRVGIDEPWEDDAPAQVQFFRATRCAPAFDAAARSHSCDAIATDENGAIPDNLEVAQRFAAAGSRAAQGEEFRAACDQQVGHGPNKLDSNATRHERPPRTQGVFFSWFGEHRRETRRTQERRLRPDGRSFRPGLLMCEGLLYIRRLSFPGGGSCSAGSHRSMGISYRPSFAWSF